MTINNGDLIINKFIFANEKTNLNFFSHKQDNNAKIGAYAFSFCYEKKFLIN